MKLNFRHILSQVSFKAKKKSGDQLRIEIKEIELRNIPSKGNFVFRKSNDFTTDGNVTEHVEQNVKGVYIKSGSRVRFVQVFSDATIDGYAVCKLNLSSSEKEQLVTSRTIQLYDEVIVEGTDLYDGKML